MKLELKSQTELRRMKESGVECDPLIALAYRCRECPCHKLTPAEKLAVVEELNRRFEHTIIGVDPVSRSPASTKLIETA